MLNLTFPRPKQANKWRPLQSISVAWLEARQRARSREYDGDKSSGCTQAKSGCSLHLQTPRAPRLGPLHPSRLPTLERLPGGPQCVGVWSWGWRPLQGRRRARLGRGARLAVARSRGRRAEGRRCRRRRRLTRGDTDAGSGRGGESQRVPSASREPERSRSCSLAGVRGRGRQEHPPREPTLSGRGGRRGGREGRAVLGTRSPLPFPGAAHSVSFPVLPSTPLREDKTKPKPPRRVAGKERATLLRDAQRRAGQAGWGRAGSEGGVRAPGGPGHQKHPSGGRGKRRGSRALAGSVGSLRVGPPKPQWACTWGGLLRGGFRNHQKAPGNPDEEAVCIVDSGPEGFVSLALGDSGRGVLGRCV